ncbi:hypothetical protein COL922a_000862 [Colletotrichum nupharicola]|nr:hypothetical protein COL922a_000862 [Colletotrichum nupharicola]
MSNASVKPFVDWISLERLFTNPEEVGRSLLHHLETVAYGPLESRLYTTTDDAWYGNSYLVDFENSHNLEGPWRVPLMAEFVLEYDETDGIDDFFRAFKERVSGTTSIDFDFTYRYTEIYRGLWISTNQRTKDKQSICQGHTTSPSARDQEVCTCEGFQLFELLGII